jgi:hypothetical protein
MGDATLTFSRVPSYNGHRLVELIREPHFIACRTACDLQYRIPVPLPATTQRSIELPVTCLDCLT